MSAVVASWDLTGKNSKATPVKGHALGFGILKGGGSKGGTQLKTPQYTLVSSKGSPRCLRYPSPLLGPPVLQNPIISFVILLYSLSRPYEPPTKMGPKLEIPFKNLP